MEPLETLDILTQSSADRARIVCTPGVLGGRPRIDGHRVGVADIAVWHERMGMSPDEIVSTCPSLSLSDVYAALAYYHDHRATIDAQIDSAHRFAEELKAQTGPSLVQRKLQGQGIDAPEDSLPSR